MSSTNVIVPPDVTQLISEREQVWAEFERSQSLVEDFRKVSAAVPNTAPAQLQLSSGTPNPPAALADALQQMKNELGAAQKLNADITACHAQIEAIKRSEKTTIALIVAGIVVASIVFLIVVVSIVSSLAS